MRFSEILVIATAVTGLVWLIDAIFWRPKRLLYVMKGSRDSVKEPWWSEYARAFFPILLIVLILRSFLAEPFRIPSGSMRPTLLEGDYIIVNKYDYGLRLPITGSKFFKVGNPKRGDVIVFKHDKGRDESIDMIKRVIGLPGDHVQYKDQTIYLNGTPLKKELIAEKEDIDSYGGKILVKEYMETIDDVQHKIFLRSNLDRKSASSLYPFLDVVVPADSYFVMGDNRDNSGDSRVWGFVQDIDVQGRAFGIWMSWDNFDPAPWYRIDNNVRWHRLMTSIQ